MAVMSCGRFGRGLNRLGRHFVVSPTAANHMLRSGETSSCDFGQYVEGKICSISRTIILANAKS